MLVALPLRLGMAICWSAETSCRGQYTETLLQVLFKQFRKRPHAQMLGDNTPVMIHM